MERVVLDLGGKVWMDGPGDTVVRDLDLNLTAAGIVTALRDVGEARSVQDRLRHEIESASRQLCSLADSIERALKPRTRRVA